MFDRTVEEIGAMARLARERRIQVRGVVMPEKYMDALNRWAGYKKTNAAAGAPPARTHREEPLEVLAEVLAEQGIPSYSLLEEITLFGTDRERYTCDDAHWRAEGHRIVAESILRQMEEEDLPPKLLQSRRARPRD